MDELADVGLPQRLQAAPTNAQDPESRALAAAGARLSVAPRVWIPAAAEEAFYRLNHLDARLAQVFDGVVSDDPDEDEIEERAPEARTLIAGHVLLDAWVDAFYDACRPLGSRVRVRRPGEEGATALTGRPALLALRTLWAGVWTDEAIVARLRAGGRLRPPARPTIVHAADRASDAAAGVEGWRAFVDERGALTRLEPRADEAPEGA